MKKSCIILIGILLSGSLTGVYGQKKAPEYRLAKRFHVEGDGCWDYLTVDESAGRIAQMVKAL